MEHLKYTLKKEFIVYTKPVDSFSARSDWLLKLRIVKNYSPDAIPGLGSQSERAKITIQWFGIY